MDTQREFFFKNLELIMGLGRHFVLKCFEAFGVFSAGLSALILVLWVPYPCFSLFNLFLIIIALVTQWKIDHLAHAQVLEKGESEHSPHLPSASHWRWDVSQINLFFWLTSHRKCEDEMWVTLAMRYESDKSIFALDICNWLI